MRDEPPAFDREDEVVRGLLGPAEVALRPLERVEGSVDFHGVHAPREVVQLAPLAEPLGVENAAPRRVYPARGADSDFRHPHLLERFTSIVAPQGRWCNPAAR